MAFDLDAMMQNTKKAVDESKKDGNYEKDTRFIKIKRDDSGNGSIVLRLIPDKNGNPFIKVFRHSGEKFNTKLGKKQYFIADCPTTIEGRKCPACERYLESWKTKDEDLIKTNKPYKRNERYISNVLIIKDPGNPENNGKIMLYEYGKQIKKIIEDTMVGDPEMEVPPINIFNPIKGANFIYKLSKQGVQVTVSDSKFLSPSSVVEDMQEAEDLIMNKSIDLSEFQNPEKYPKYEDIEKKIFYFENGRWPDEEDKVASSNGDEDEDDEELPWDKKEEEPAPKSKEEEPAPKSKEEEPAPKSKPKKKEPAPADDEEDFFDSL